MLESVNSALPGNPLTAEKLRKLFETWWPELEGKLKAIAPPKNATNPKRNTDDLLNEILEIVRSMDKSSALREEKDFIFEPARIGAVIPRGATDIIKAYADTAVANGMTREQVFARWGRMLRPSATECDGETGARG